MGGGGEGGGGGLNGRGLIVPDNSDKSRCRSRI